MPRLPKDKYGVVTFVVRGRGDFPFDMLRYDSAAPATGEDVASMITEKYSDAENGWSPTTPRSVKLRRFYPAGGTAAPNVERWRSFGWSVIEVYP